MENEFLRVRFSESGTIGILDKETGREVFARGILVVMPSLLTTKATPGVMISRPSLKKSALSTMPK